MTDTPRTDARPAAETPIRSIVAMGSRPFVRQLTMGGAIGQVVTPDGAAEALRARLSDRSVALIMLEVSLVERLPQDLYRQAFYSREPEVVALGGAWNVVLRRRIRQVLGADLLAESES